jgi:hypothetical protein
LFSIFVSHFSSLSLSLLFLLFLTSDLCVWLLLPWMGHFSLPLVFLILKHITDRQIKRLHRHKTSSKLFKDSRHRCRCGILDRSFISSASFWLFFTLILASACFWKAPLARQTGTSKTAFETEE